MSPTWVVVIVLVIGFYLIARQLEALTTLTREIVDILRPPAPTPDPLEAFKELFPKDVFVDPETEIDHSTSPVYRIRFKCRNGHANLNVSRVKPPTDPQIHTIRIRPKCGTCGGHIQVDIPWPPPTTSPSA